MSDILGDAKCLSDHDHTTAWVCVSAGGTIYKPDNCQRDFERLMVAIERLTVVLEEALLEEGDSTV